MSWGAFCWIRDLPALARVIAGFLRPGGFFYAVDGHPMGMSLDEKWTPGGGPLSVRYDYETGDEPNHFQWGPDYTGAYVQLTNASVYEWSHGLGRIVTSLIDAGLQSRVPA